MLIYGIGSVIFYLKIYNQIRIQFPQKPRDIYYYINLLIYLKYNYLWILRPPTWIWKIWLYISLIVNIETYQHSFKSWRKQQLTVSPMKFFQVVNFAFFVEYEIFVQRLNDIPTYSRLRKKLRRCVMFLFLPVLVSVGCLIRPKDNFVCFLHRSIVHAWWAKWL